MCLCVSQHRYINSQTYAKKRSNDRWSAAETNRFYHALACFGTDFTAIAKLFPGRDRWVGGWVGTAAAGGGISCVGLSAAVFSLDGVAGLRIPRG